MKYEQNICCQPKTEGQSQSHPKGRVLISTCLLLQTSGKMKSESSEQECADFDKQLMAGFFASSYLSDNLTHSISHGISISSISVYQLEQLIGNVKKLAVSLTYKRSAKSEKIGKFSKFEKLKKFDVFEKFNKFVILSKFEKFDWKIPKTFQVQKIWKIQETQKIWKILKIEKLQNLETVVSLENFENLKDQKN